MAVLLKCNKIKKLGVNQLKQVKEACEASAHLEVKDDQVRRLANKSLPELKLLGKKRVAEAEVSEDSKKMEEMDPIILEISTAKPTDIKWSTMKDKFRELNPSLEIAYIRFKDNCGHIGVYDKLKKLSFTPSIEIEGVHFAIKRCEGDELIEFWSKHGSHFDLCIGKSQKEKKGKGKKNPNDLKKEVELGGEIYNSLTPIKMRTRKILALTKDGEKIENENEKFVHT